LKCTWLGRQDLDRIHHFPMAKCQQEIPVTPETDDVKATKAGNESKTLVYACRTLRSSLRPPLLGNSSASKSFHGGYARRNLLSSVAAEDHAAAFVKSCHGSSSTVMLSWTLIFLDDD
jgi:hypothetical protein